MTEIQIYQRFNLPLLFWERKGDDPKNWKGPVGIKGWNDPKRTYDLSRFDPVIHNLGTFTGREISPGRFLTDSDFDKLNIAFARAFFPKTGFGTSRPGKSLSHVLYTTPTVLKGRLKYDDQLKDGNPYIELRGLGVQTMLPPSLHTPPNNRVALIEGNNISHVDLAVLEAATLNYGLASLVADKFPGGFHHEVRLALAGYLLKRQFDAERVTKLIETICRHQVDCRVPDMSVKDVNDAADVVGSTIARLKNHEKVSGSKVLKEVNEDFFKILQSYLPHVEGDVATSDFYSYLPTRTFLFVPTREFWPASSVNARVRPIPTGEKDDEGAQQTIQASVWLDQNRPVEQMTWAPGLPMIVQDRLVADGGWIERPGCSCVNLYRPPTVTLGDARLAGPWLDLVCKVYPEHVDHLVAWFAHQYSVRKTRSITPSS